METATRDDFSAACPKCGSADIRPVTQHNNFDATNPAGEPEPGAHHVTTSRGYECGKCAHQWAETVPHPR
jgi:ribosomal protein S27AE